MDTPAPPPLRRPLSRRLYRLALAGLAVLLLSVAGIAWAAGFFDGDPLHDYGIDGAVHPVATAYFSGDMGLRFGMGTHVAPALAENGIPVIGISSPAVFNRHRSQAEVDALVAESIHHVMARTGADRVILMGQSFGADILASGLPALSPADRAHVEAIVLVVPDTAAYFRADPSGLAYDGTPDAQPAAAMRRVDWAPVICIYGARETTSLCPGLIGTGARVVELPGGHFLNKDHRTLVRTILTALRGVRPPESTT